MGRIRFAGIWIALSFVTLLLCFGAQLGLGEFGTLGFLERHWFAFKQSFQRLNTDHYSPSTKVSLLELNYDNRVDFWSDVKVRKELARKIEQYSGPVILNLDPLRLTKDPYLKKIFYKANVIRPVRIDRASVRDLDERAMEAERIAASMIEQTRSLEAIGELVKVQPADPYYYEPPYLWGALQFTQDLNSQFIHQYPLVLSGGRLNVPTMAFAAVTAIRECQRYFYSETKAELELSHCGAGKNETINLGQVQHPLPLFYYSRPLQRISLADWRSAGSVTGAPKSLVIIDVVDPSSRFSTLRDSAAIGKLGALLSEYLEQWGMKQKSSRASTFSENANFTWSQLVGTAVSNIIEGHSPIRPKTLHYFEGFLFVVLALVLFISAQRQRLKGVISISLGTLGGVVLLDLCLTYFWNMRTQFVEEMMSLAGFALVGISTRSIVDFEERSLVEKAFSGYVNSERLKRLLSGKEKLKLEGRRHELTTMILDIAGFSVLTRPLDIEKVFQMMRRVYEVTDPIIFEFGGTIDKKTGDGFLAFFGDGENEISAYAAQRAVECALRIQEAFKSIDPKHFGVSERIQMRIGVNTGEMMVGNTGSEKHFNYTVLGDPVNFTQRLEAACPVGEVLVGPLTAKYIAPRWKSEERHIHVKNEKELAKAYLVLAHGGLTTSSENTVTNSKKKKKWA